MKILYLMHVDWNWIKQRPHFIAEKFYNKKIDIDVYYQKYFYKDRLTENAKGNLSIHNIPRLPLSRFLIVKKINQIAYERLILKLIKKGKYDFVYITHPSLYFSEIPVPIVYDCMDDVLAFSDDKLRNKEMFDLEKDLVNKAKFVLFTAENLQNTVLKRFGLEFKREKYLINNNAVELPATKDDKIFDLGASNKVKLVYIGTITEWFDFGTLEKLDTEKYEIHLFGPIYNIKESFPENFIIHGTVSRDLIFSIMQAADILIMPFKVTELIKSVNPVKLYEYIYSCKPVITVRYGESEKFSDYVYLYESETVEEFQKCLDKILVNGLKNKNSEVACKKFVENNTWDKRADDIIEFITRQEEL